MVDVIFRGCLWDAIRQSGIGGRCRFLVCDWRRRRRDFSRFVNDCRSETIKKFFVCPEEFTIDGGLLTPSMKVKKKVALERYKAEVDAMYDPAA